MPVTRREGATSAFSASAPSSVRVNTPAPATSISAMATCPATSTTRDRRRTSRVLAPRDRIASAISARNPSQAATPPIRAIAASDAVRAPTTTLESSDSSSASIVTPPGNWKARSAWKIANPTGIARAAPALVNTAPSIATPRASRARDAPSARHIANSPERASVRTRSSVPTVRQPASSSRATVTPRIRANCVTPARVLLGSASTSTGDTASRATRRGFSNGSAARRASSCAGVDAERPISMTPAVGDISTFARAK